MVDAVAKLHPEAFKFETRDAKTHPEEVKKYELGSHGIVCVDEKGEPLWSHPGHDMKQEVLDAAVTDLLKKL